MIYEEQVRAAFERMADETLDPSRTYDVLRRGKRRAGVFRRVVTVERPAGRRSGRWSPRSLLPTAVGMAVVVAVAVVAVHTGQRPGSLSTGPDPIATSPEVTGGVRQILLAAAERTLKTPTSSDRYRVTKTEEGNLRQVGSAGNRYQIMARTRHETWHAAAAKDRSWSFSQWVGAAPATAADEAAWRRAGSPSSWPTEQPPGCGWTTPDRMPKPAQPPGPGDEIQSGPGSLSGRPLDENDLSFHLGADDVTEQELRALPTDPGRLREVLLDKLRQDTAAPDTEEHRNWSLSDDAVDLIHRFPVSKEVRSAAYRMLAELPDVTSAGTVTDPTGRRGVGLDFTWHFGPAFADSGGPTDVRLIIDQETGQALAVEERKPRPEDDMRWMPANALFHYTALISEESTADAPPAVPASEPRFVKVCGTPPVR